MTQTSFAAAALIAIALAACRQASPDTNTIDHDAASPTANSALPANPATQPDANVVAAENAAAAANGMPGPITNSGSIPPSPSTRSKKR